MFVKVFKILLFISLFYQSSLYSKSNSLNSFNPSNLSSYFSGILAHKNQNNSDALKFFRISKNLINKHDPFLQNYVTALVLESKVKEAINELNRNLEKNDSKFFEAYLLLAIDHIKKGNFQKSREYILESRNFINDSRFETIIVESILGYLYTFEKKEILSQTKKFGKLSDINQTFLNCYLGNENVESHFQKIINQDYDDNSRYTYFYISFLIENGQFSKVEKLAENIESLNSSLLISQAKNWVRDNRYNKFNEIFSCKNQSHVTSEFFFLIASLFSSQENYEKSNFYLNISNFLNPKFNFNLSLIAQNYYLNRDYQKTKKILKNFKKDNQVYYWFRIKKMTQIISKEKNNNEALKFVSKKFDKIEKKNLRILYDMANFYKNSENYDKAILFYSEIISKLNKDSIVLADILFRRGGSYERSGDYNNSDKDLLKSIELNPDSAYVLNYLAYSWLERNIKIDEALIMLEKAYELKSNDPYIIDSIGWAYYLINDFLKAEQFMKRAVEMMPEDPIVNDHYGDILWKLDRKIQARYFWNNVLKFDDTEEKLKKIINIKLVEGLKNGYL